MWLGSERGYLSDWLTQCWVQATGRRVAIADPPWLDGPVGETRGIGPGLLPKAAARERGAA